MSCQLLARPGRSVCNPLRARAIGLCVSCLCLVLLVGTADRPPAAQGQEPFTLDRLESIPLPDHQVSLRRDGVELVRWHFGEQYPRPFFYPLVGPHGTILTRMGHPGASNHDHHRSIWFAHHKVGGVDFWSDQTEARIRQKMWYAYRDGDRETMMASQLGWYDGQGRELMEQDLVAALLDLGPEGHALELQITLRPGGDSESVELQRTNFGFLAVRVAKTLSAHFGGGQIRDDAGRVGEQSIFGERSRWMDYTGPLRPAQNVSDPRRTTVPLQPVVAGITYHDHPDNPRYPTRWHVREDGWMGASFCMDEGYSITRDEPLTLRYLLHAHGGNYEAEEAAAVHEAFSRRPGFRVFKSERKHRQYDVEREE